MVSERAGIVVEELCAAAIPGQRERIKLTEMYLWSVMGLVFTLHHQARGRNAKSDSILP
jgi:hypothetical protein